MTFGRGLLLPQNYKILRKRPQKLPKLLCMKEHDRNRERLNMSRSPDNFFFMTS